MPLMTKADGMIIRDVESGDYEGLVQFFDSNNIAEVTRHFHPFPLSASAAWHIGIRHQASACSWTVASSAVGLAPG
jgi:hypothetical protein